MMRPYGSLAACAMLVLTAPASANGIDSLMRALDARAGYEATLEMAWCKGEECEVRTARTTPLANCGATGLAAALQWQRNNPEFADHELAWFNCWTGERS